MKAYQLTIGQKYGRLTVLNCAGKDSHRGMRWRCKCDCGNEVSPRGSAILSGITKSCGCLQKERSPEIRARISASKNVHGTSHNPELKSTWVSWGSMNQRCFNPKRQSFKDYGGRGIFPCGFIKKSPLNLIEIIGKRPNGLSIDRINNSSGYTCGKCPECVENGWLMNLKWSTKKEQNSNKRNNVFVKIDGVSKLRHEWAAELGVSISHMRLNYYHCEHKL